jgi:hypothetical protein
MGRTLYFRLASEIQQGLMGQEIKQFLFNGFNKECCPSKVPEPLQLISSNPKSTEAGESLMCADEAVVKEEEPAAKEPAEEENVPMEE